MIFLTSILLTVMTNLTYSPDSTRAAFTSGNDLYVVNLAARDTVRLTDDGSDVILNGYASWVYYEEIFGRPSRYKAFWWSPDSKKLAFYRFDQSGVNMFPIYSPFGQDGTLRQTRYPKAGETNPSVKVCIADLDAGTTATVFDDSDDVYFGTPFWGADSKELFVSRMPRRQSELDMYAVNVSDGSRREVYHEEYPTWIEWIEGMLFTEKGLYMARDFESGWQQIYFLPYDGSGLKCLTEGRNWGIQLEKVDDSRKCLWFTACRESRLHPALYRLNLRNGRITALTDADYWVRNVEIGDDGSFSAECSNAAVPWFKVSASFRQGSAFGKGFDGVQRGDGPGVPQIIEISNDGYDLYGLITYPEGFDESEKYPVIMEVYGGPGTAYVRDRWGDRDATNKWCSENGIIYMVVDPRSSGENGRKGMDEAFRRMTVMELSDYMAWARYLQSLPYVDSEHIGVEGFSFGGTTTAMLVLRYPGYFRCGIAGGGVYDWHLYDTHYTERYMCSPSVNPDGYAEASVLNFVEKGLVSPDYRPYSLKITHGTGDDNVHFQNSLQLIDALQRKGIKFEMMIYPDGMHGYRGKQNEHSTAADHDFWMRNLFE